MQVSSFLGRPAGVFHFTIPHVILVAVLSTAHDATPHDDTDTSHVTDSVIWVV